MVRSDPSFGIHIAMANPLFVKDASAFLIIVNSARNRGFSRASGVPNLLDKILQEATVYFLAIFTSHLLLIFFEFFAPVSDLSTDLFSSTHDELHIGINSTPPCKVSHRLECCDKDEFDKVLSYLQRECSVSFSFIASSPTPRLTRPGIA